MGVFAAFSGGKIFSGFPGFSAPTQRGARTALAGSPLTGGSFSAPESRDARTALACSPLTGGKFSAEPQRGIRRLRTAGASRRPPRGAKRKGHLRFPFLFELLPFPCFLIRRRFPICDRFEKRGTAEDFFYRVFRNLFAGSDTLLLHISEGLRRRGITVPRNSLARCDRQHLRI